jgi:sulfate transport system ATP-binding protein
VLLLDEPFGALDAQVRRDLRRWLRELHERTGHTTLFVTHDQEEALELADRVAILHRGRIEQIGTPDEVLDRPATAFVAGFVGEAVRLPVEVSGRSLRIGSHSIEVPSGTKAGPADLFIRPHDLALADAAGGDALPATILSVRRTGSARRAELLFDDGLPAVEIELALGQTVRKGQTVHVRLLSLRLYPQ